MACPYAGGRGAGGCDGMDGAVEGGAEEIVHGGVHDNEVFAAIALGVEDAGEQHAGGADESATGFEKETAAERADERGEGAGVGVECGGAFAGVADAEAAAEVEIVECDAGAGELADVAREATEGAAEGSEVEDLRADVSADAAPLDPARVAMGEVEAEGVAPVHAEFVAAMAGGDVRVTAGFDVGIDANGGGSGAAEASGFGGEEIKLGGGLDVEEKNAGAEGVAQLVAGFADAGEDDATSGDADAAQTGKLAAADNVKATAEAGEEAQDGEVGVGFDGVAKRVRQRGKGAVEAMIGGGDGGARVDVGGSAEAGGNGFEGDAFAVKRAAAVGEKGSEAGWVEGHAHEAFSRRASRIAEFRIRNFRFQTRGEIGHRDTEAQRKSENGGRGR